MSTFPIITPDPPLVEKGVQLPGLQPVNDVPLPPVAGSAVDLPLETDELDDFAAPADSEIGPGETTPPRQDIVDTPQYKRLQHKLLELERRQRGCEKNILILAAACAFVIYQLRKLDSPVTVAETVIEAVPDLPA